MRIIIIFLCSFLITSNAHAFSGQVIERGAFGDDVIELQARLQYLGIYHGEIDGKFGYGTYNAVRQFQEQYGLNVDGVAGQGTKQKLVNNSDFNKQWVHNQINQGNRFTHYGGMPLENQVQAKSVNPQTAQLPSKYTEKDIQIMANAVYGEARGEPYEGQVAVAAVILNRLESPEFPDTISGIIFQPLAFTAVADGQINVPIDENSTVVKAAQDALNGWDPTNGCIYYFNPDTATSSWIWSKTIVKTIGKHHFCK